jgi:ornithine cyclodeaminase/alanine dehydrogenase-like protein (mu-crystallin family)
MSQGMPQLGLGLIGSGRIAQAHLKAASNLRDLLR